MNTLSLQEKIQQLPPELVIEIEHYTDFLLQQYRTQNSQENVVVGKAALDILQQNNLIGCLEESADFSEKYKQYIDWNEKV